MSYRALGIYREPEFSPGKVEADAAILDATMAELKREGVEIQAVDAVSFATGADSSRRSGAADVPGTARAQAAGRSRAGGRESRSTPRSRFATAIATCSAPGLEQAGVPTPPGALVPAGEPLDVRKLAGLDLSAGVFVKRGDLHALAPEDVQRAADRAEVESILGDFARRGIRFAYVQQEVVGRVVKFYGVSGGAHFSVHPEGEEVAEAAVRALSEAAPRPPPRRSGSGRGAETRS